MPKKILVVDDDLLICDMLESLLKDEGFIIHKADGVATALDLVKSCDYDLLLIDKNMPGTYRSREGGIDLLEHVRAMSPCAKVIIMTGNPTAQSMVEAFELGAFDYIEKPFSLTQLRKKIKNILANASDAF